MGSHARTPTPTTWEAGGANAYPVANVKNFTVQTTYPVWAMQPRIVTSGADVAGILAALSGWRS